MLPEPNIKAPRKARKHSKWCHTGFITYLKAILKNLSQREESSDSTLTVTCFLIKHLLSTYQVLGMVLGVSATDMSKIQLLP